MDDTKLKKSFIFVVVPKSRNMERKSLKKIFSSLCLFFYSSENKLDFAGHPPKMAKFIGDQNLLSWFQS